MPVGNEGSGTPAAGKYVDGGTGAWTTIPVAGVSEATLSQSQNMGSGAATGQYGANYFLVNTHTVVRLHLTYVQRSAGCTTQDVHMLKDITGGGTVASITGQNGVNDVDSGVLSTATTAGHVFGFGISTSALGCTTFGIVPVTATYQ